MVLDYNIFESIKGTTEQPDKLFYVAEENPKEIIAHDISKHFYKFSFFGSYNRAFFKETQEDLNIDYLEQVYGKFLGYDEASRGKQFHLLEKEAINFKKFKDVLRHNGYKIGVDGDPSKNDPSSGISSRSDVGGYKHFSGGIDTKVTKLEFVKELVSVAISGPTTENNKNLTPFSWSKSGDTRTSRVGVPDVYNFPYIKMSPKTLENDSLADVVKFTETDVETDDQNDLEGDAGEQ
jgi:hypothetical protein